jgi:hypothetical protein
MRNSQPRPVAAVLRGRVTGCIDSGTLLTLTWELSTVKDDDKNDHDLAHNVSKSVP